MNEVVGVVGYGVGGEYVGEEAEVLRVDGEGVEGDFLTDLELGEAPGVTGCVDG